MGQNVNSKFWQYISRERHTCIFLFFFFLQRQILLV